MACEQNIFKCFKNRNGSSQIKNIALKVIRANAMLYKV